MAEFFKLCNYLSDPTENLQTMPTTLDFHIRSQEQNSFSLEVFARGKTQPLVHTTFDYDLSYMTTFEINRLDVDAKDPQGRWQRLQAFGTKLYEKIFIPEVRKVWQEHKDKSDFLELCLRLAPEAKDLEALPWETLYDGEEFLAAGAKIGLSRLPLDVEIQDALPPLAPPLKMLALMSSPLDLAEDERLQIEREQEILLQAVNAPAGQGKLQLVFEDEAKLPILENVLEDGYHIWHYSGHGIAPENGGGLLLEDADGKKRLTSIADLMQTLQKAEKDLRLAVISGCQTARTRHSGGFRDLARSLLQRKIPAVLAMQFSITDTAGLLFAEELYPRVTEGQSLTQAMSACRRKLLHDDNVIIRSDAFAPVLFAAHNQVLQLSTTQAPTATAAPELDFSFHLPLPQLSFGFYGRRKEYRAIRDGLLQRNHRAVIIHGMGGIGKTALISHIAQRLQPKFKGVYAFDCTGAALAPETILLELHRYLERQGVKTLEPLLHQSIPPEQLATWLGQVLSQWPLLLIFDNFETQLEQPAISNESAASGHPIANDNLRAFLKTLIKTTATGTRFVFTSRYLFDVDDKRVGTVQAVPLDELSRPEAIGLMQKLPNLSAAAYSEKWQAIAKFGGHPYALVTLDRHCSHKPLTNVLQDAATVHTELREFLAIELSYANLSEPARQLLNRLAAFRKPVPHEAAEWVLGEKVDDVLIAKHFFRGPDLNPKLRELGEDEFVREYKDFLPEQRHAEDIDQPITELIGWGLLTPLAQDQTLAVHSLVRDFCRDKQTQENWRDFLLDAAAFYTNQTKLQQRDDKTPEAVWTEMAAFELLMTAQVFNQAANLLLNLQKILRRWGFGRLLESQYQRLSQKVDTAYSAKIGHNIAILLQNRGDYAAALEQYEKSLQMKEELGDRAGVSSSLHQIGMIHQHRGDYDPALEQYKKSLQIKEELGNRAGVSSSLHQIGIIHQHRGDYDAALEQYEKSLQIKEELGDRDSVSSSLHQIGNIHYLRGDYAAALEQYKKALQITEELGDRAGVSSSLHQIGMIHQHRGDYDPALEQYEKSLQIKEELGDRAGVANSHGQMGQLFVQREKYAEAFDKFLFALITFSELQSPNVNIATNDLKKLREQWGAENFDKVWQEKTGDDVPEELK